MWMTTAAVAVPVTAVAKCHLSKQKKYGRSIEEERYASHKRIKRTKRFVHRAFSCTYSHLTFPIRPVLVNFECDTVLSVSRLLFGHNLMNLFGDVLQRIFFQRKIPKCKQWVGCRVYMHMINFQLLQFRPNVNDDPLASASFSNGEEKPNYNVYVVQWVG